MNVLEVDVPGRVAGGYNSSALSGQLSSAAPASANWPSFRDGEIVSFESEDPGGKVHELIAGQDNRSTQYAKLNNAAPSSVCWPASRVEMNVLEVNASERVAVEIATARQLDSSAVLRLVP